ncbi:hypothetical protein BC6307_19400 [Sutcliffiella cohnii]|uniref:Uncharacterized protein n=1 Tax=Sutcliffiella cohnii TaxID=33932 RepID=A0A223KUV3_9BACI|nr:hypothetical protein [Sutcliffiella cohnii]AST93269.1 hypothetical protein BC6307_19400 [Sutcliffiella cohnii]
MLENPQTLSARMHELDYIMKWVREELEELDAINDADSIAVLNQFHKRLADRRFTFSIVIDEEE